MRFSDEEIRLLNPKNPREMVRLVELFVGEPIQPLKADQELLTSMLKNMESVSCEQLNEILLVLNQDRVARHFFDFFIASDRPATLDELRNGIEKFRGYAMLCYGNFKFAFKKLNSLPPDEFRTEIQQACALAVEEVKKKYEHRPKKARGILPIDRNDTWYVGYLSARKLDRDTITFVAILLASGRATEEEIGKRLESELWEERCKELEVSTPLEIEQNSGRERYQEEEQGIQKEVARITNEAAKTAKLPRLNARKWAPLLGDIRIQLDSMRGALRKNLERAKINTNVYLTWDYMDVYVATSMREKWEYQATFDFLQEVFKNSEVKKLNVRYFDPTQSYSSNRIDKGLVEGLMLRRAACTVYLAQETDTLGKDSELASTLAQGKPVIAYVPEIVKIDKHAQRIAKEPIGFLWKRWLLLEAEEIFTDQACLQELEETFKTAGSRASKEHKKSVLEWKDELFTSLRRCVSSRTFNVIQQEDDEFKVTLGGEFETMCKIVAVGEKHYFNKRTSTLRNSHPLAIQVHLDTGVANGVLVVRSAKDCARLIVRLLTKNLSFKVVHRKGMTELQEDVSECPYRVVTDDVKLTNSFWNFYLTGKTFKG